MLSSVLQDPASVQCAPTLENIFSYKHEKKKKKRERCKSLDNRTQLLEER